VTPPDELHFEVADFADELSAAADSVAVGSRLLFENSRVRVWDIQLDPGERLRFHRHRTSYFYRCHSGSRTRVRFPDGRAIEYDSEAGEVDFHSIGPDDVVVHDLENVGDAPLRFTTVELLDR
jgi:beta-alanine degradation protein BauB